MTFWNGSEWVPDQADPPKRSSRRRRIFGATLEATLIVALTFGLIAGTAFAAKGGNGHGGAGSGHGGGKNRMSGTISLVLLAAPDANYGEGVRFDVVTNAPWPFVDVDCTQAGSVVYHSTVGYYGGWPWGDTFTLAGWMWPGGGADCVATLYNSDGSVTTTLATLPFPVEP